MKPILFNTSAVRAILEGRKTVTRRVVKPQPLEVYHNGELFEDDGDLIARVKAQNGRYELLGSPYHPGDILYVQETWDRVPVSATSPDYYYYYKADGDIRPDGWQYGWRPSIHMPSEAVRIFLRVTQVRVEQLHQMEVADFAAEGMTPRWYRRPGQKVAGCDCASRHDGCKDEPCPNRDKYERTCWSLEFIKLWESCLKAPDRYRYGWLANPWVWVIEFELMSKEEETKQ